MAIALAFVFYKTVIASKRRGTSDATSEGGTPMATVQPVVREAAALEAAAPA